MLGKSARNDTVACSFTVSYIWAVDLLLEPQASEMDGMLESISRLDQNL